MGLDNVTAVNLAGTNTAVVRALRTRETALGPAVGPTIGTKKGVFLLQTKPEVFLCMRFHQSGCIVAVVVFIRSAIGAPSFAKHDDVIATTEGVGVDSNWTKVDIGVFTGGLACRRAIEIPFGQFIDGLNGFG